jgi:hypothetical protein
LEGMLIVGSFTGHWSLVIGHFFSGRFESGPGRDCAAGDLGDDVEKRSLHLVFRLYGLDIRGEGVLGRDEVDELFFHGNVGHLVGSGVPGVSTRLMVTVTPAGEVSSKEALLFLKSFVLALAMLFAVTSCFLRVALRAERAVLIASDMP